MADVKSLYMDGRYYHLRDDVYEKILELVQGYVVCEMCGEDLDPETQAGQNICIPCFEKKMSPYDGSCRYMGRQKMGDGEYRIAMMQRPTGYVLILNSTRYNAAHGPSYIKEFFDVAESLKHWGFFVRVLDKVGSEVDLTARNTTVYGNLITQSAIIIKVGIEEYDEQKGRGKNKGQWITIPNYYLVYKWGGSLKIPEKGLKGPLHKAMILAGREIEQTRDEEGIYHLEGFEPTKTISKSMLYTVASRIESERFDREGVRIEMEFGE